MWDPSTSGATEEDSALSKLRAKFKQRQQQEKDPISTASPSSQPQQSDSPSSSPPVQQYEEQIPDEDMESTQQMGLMSQQVATFL